MYLAMARFKNTTNGQTPWFLALPFQAAAALFPARYRCSGF